MIKLETAIKVLRQKYAEAKKNVNIYDPVAYALYYTWREVEVRRLKNDNK
jgi:hypothetical protein